MSERQHEPRQPIRISGESRHAEITLPEGFIEPLVAAAGRPLRAPDFGLDALQDAIDLAEPVEQLARTLAAHGRDDRAAAAELTALAGADRGALTLALMGVCDREAQRRDRQPRLPIALGGHRERRGASRRARGCSTDRGNRALPGPLTD